MKTKLAMMRTHNAFLEIIKEFLEKNGAAHLFKSLQEMFDKYIERILDRAARKEPPGRGRLDVVTRKWPPGRGRQDMVTKKKLPGHGRQDVVTRMGLPECGH